MVEKSEPFQKKALGFVIFMISFPIIAVILIFLGDVTLRLNGFDIVQIFTAELYYGGNYTFLESLFALDRFAGEFLKSILIAVCLTGIYLTVFKHQNEFNTPQNTTKNSKFIKITALLLVILILTLNIVALFGIGILNQHLMPSLLYVLVTNYFPDFFSYSLLTYISIVPLAASISTSFKNQLNDDPNWKASKLGIPFLVGYLISIQVMLIIFPIRTYQFATAYVVEDLIFTWLEVLFITGIFSAYYYRKTKLSGKAIPQNKSLELTAFNRLSTFSFSVMFIIIAAILTINTNHFALTAFGLLQRFFIMLFRILLVLFLYNFRLSKAALKSMETKIEITESNTDIKEDKENIIGGELNE